MKKKTKAFTLIELLLSVMILALLGIYAWMSINASFESQKTMERFARLQEMGSAVLGKLSLDLGQAFIIPSSQNLTFFKGRENEIEFTSLSKAPLTIDAKESEQTEITYKMDNNPNRTGLNLLLRSETSFLDGPIEKREEDKFEVLTGQLVSWSLEYSKDGRVYVKAWDTTTAEYRDTLPKIIKVTIELKDDTDPKNPRDAVFETFIDVPMSDYAGFAPAQPTGQQPGGAQPGQTPQQGQPGQPGQPTPGSGRAPMPSPFDPGGMN